MSYIHHTRWHWQHCHVANIAQQCILGFFQVYEFAGDLDDSKSTSGRILCNFGSRTYVPISWMCKTGLSVTHKYGSWSNHSLDEDLCMDGIPALDLWDLVIEVFHSSPNQTKKATDVRAPLVKLVGKHWTKHAETNSNHAHQSRSDQYWSRSSSVTRIGSNAKLYVFDDHEAVIW